MGVSKMPSRGEPELCGISISASGMELGKMMSSVWPTAHKGAEGNGFGGNARKDIKGVSGNNIGEVRDYSNAVPGISGLIGRCVNRRSSTRKSGGRVRM
jgi:hypothetical protein